MEQTTVAIEGVDAVEALQEYGCESCLEQFYEGKDTCHVCGFDLNSFNVCPEDSDDAQPQKDNGFCEKT